MSDLRKAAQQALESLEMRCGTNAEERGPDGVITAIKQALAEPEQAPFILQNDAIAMRRPELRESRQVVLAAGTAIYTSPTPRNWFGLTDEEIYVGLCRSPHALQTAQAWRDGVEWAQEQLKEKNT